MIAAISRERSLWPLGSAGSSPACSCALIYLVVLLMETASLFFFPSRNALIPAPGGRGGRRCGQRSGLHDTAGEHAGGSRRRRRDPRRLRVVGAGGRSPSTSASSTSQSTFFRPALLGPRAGVFIDSLTFLVSAAGHHRHQGVDQGSSTEEKLDLSLIGKDVIESFRFLGQHEELRSFLVTIGLAILGGGTIIPVGLDLRSAGALGARPVPRQE